MWFWVPNSIQLLLWPISNLMTHFAAETNFLEELSDLLTKSAALATSGQCQTHPHKPTNLVQSYFYPHISWRNKFSSSIESGAISYWQGHSWIFLRCGRSDIWNYSRLKCYTATIKASTLPMPSIYLFILIKMMSLIVGQFFFDKGGWNFFQIV